MAFIHPWNQHANITIWRTLDLARKFPVWKQFCQGCSRGNCWTTQNLLASTFEPSLPSSFFILRQHIIHPSLSHAALIVYNLSVSRCSTLSLWWQCLAGGWGKGDWGMIEQTYFKLLTIQTILSGADYGDRNPLLEDDLGKCFGDWMHFILSIPLQSNPQFPETFLALQLSPAAAQLFGENIKHGKPLKRWQV